MNECGSEVFEIEKNPHGWFECGLAQSQCETPSSYLPLLWCYVDCTKSKTNKMELLYRGNLIQTCLSIEILTNYSCIVML